MSVYLHGGFPTARPLSCSKFARKVRAALHSTSKCGNGSVYKWKAPADHGEASLYVHWPYCKQLCTFCNFNKYVRDQVDHARMRSCLVTETTTLLKLASVQKVKSVYFGGGTPSLSEAQTVSAILETVSRLCHLETDAEVTLESNPTSVETQSLSEFKMAGVNRISLGLQGLNDQDLYDLGRDHTVEDSLKALEKAKQLFPGRVSIDLLFGRPNQSAQDWEQELEKVLPLCDDHVSLYELTIERGTPLYRDVKNGRRTLPNSDSRAEMYRNAVETLEIAGFFRYEVANFAKSEAESRHNLSYWSGASYVGVGPGAHGSLARYNNVTQYEELDSPWLTQMKNDYTTRFFVPVGEGSTARHARVQALEPDTWMKEVETFGHATRKETAQSYKESLEEIVMLGLRTSKGLTAQTWQQFASENWTIADVFHDSQVTQELAAAGLLSLDKSGLRATSKGLYVIDSILPALLLHLDQFLSRQDQKSAARATDNT